MRGDWRRHWLILALGAGIGAAAITLGFLSEDWLSNRDKLALGRRLYVKHCASCHGAKLEGQPNWQDPLPNNRMPAPPHDASGHTWHHADRDLFLITKQGLGVIVPDYESDMPAFESVLTDQEIHAILAFIKSTWPEREREYQETQTKARP